MEQSSKLNYTLGLDIGTNSIGWAMLRVGENNEPCAIMKMGSRIFSDGREEKSGESLAVARRTARGQRRNLDRRLQMYQSLLNYLISSGLLPENDKKRQNLSILNPYEIRSNATNKKVNINHLGRALIHLAKHRGFKSNRIADKKADDEKGKISSAITRFYDILKNENCKTVGEYFYKLNQEGVSVRSRLRVVAGLKAKTEYERYLDRQMILDEYRLIMSIQKKYHTILSDKVIADIEKIIFTQRPLKPQEVGKCSIYPDEFRASKALSIAQEFIYLQKLHDLRVYAEEKNIMRPLNENEFEYLKHELSLKTKMTYASIKKELKKNKFAKEYGDFNFETNEKELKGNLSNCLMSDTSACGNTWNTFDDKKKNAIVMTILSGIKTDSDIINYLIEDCQLAEENAKYILSETFKKLPDGYMQYSLKFLDQIVPLMRNYGGNFTTAKDALNIAEVEVEKTDLLPYYGHILTGYLGSSSGNIEDIEEKRFGKIANPTVHIALNELRKLINALILKYGKPTKIVIEIGRELKQNQKQKDNFKKEQEANRARNEKFIESYPNMKLSRDDLLKLRLWTELGKDDGARACVYTGTLISASMLFSNEVQIEHILPFSKTLDDSYANKTLSLLKANYYKGNRSPYEAFHSNPDKYNYEDILLRAKSCLPANKVWRFDKDAMDRFDEDKNFEKRQLTDMQYISKLTTIYLKAICEEKNILSTPGRLTALLRDKLGLNKLISNDGEKNRNDHRHHAIDALVVALITRSLLQKVSTAAARVEKTNKAGNAFRMIEKFPEPFPHFHKRALEAINNIKVSHKPDHGKAGELHEGTAYGIVKNPVDGYELVTRKPITDLTSKMISNIRDSKIREAILQEINGGNASDIKTLLQKFGEENNIRKVRYLVKAVPEILIKNRDGKPYKNYDSGANLCLEVYKMPNDKLGFEVISRFNANQKGFKTKWQDDSPDAKLLLRLYKGDTLTYKENDKKTLMKISSIAMANRRLILLDVREAGNIQKRQKEEDQIYVYKSFNPLFNVLKAEQVNVTIIGEVKKAQTPCDKLWLCDGECVNSKNEKCLKKG